jgi:hypothetical protein
MRAARTRVIAVALAVAMFVAAGCGGGGDDGDRARGEGHKFATGTFTDAELLYGTPPPTSGYTYQPDVVIVGGGAESVRSVSSDGIVWTIKGTADNIDEVEVGKVMFVTGRGVGRVRQVQKVGDDVAVALGPVDLTEVYRDAEIEIDQPVDLTNMALVETPDLLGAVTDPAQTADVDASAPAKSTATTPAASTDGSASVQTMELPAVQLISVVRPPKKSKLPPASLKTSFQLTVDNWSVEGFTTGKDNGAFDVTLKVTRTTGPLRIGITVTVHLLNPKVRASASISGGNLKHSSAKLSGVQGIDVDVKAGSENGLADNVKARVEVPMDIILPIFEPFLVAFRQKFIIETAFSSKNSTLEGHGEYRFTGPIGDSEAEAGSVGVETVKSMTESLTGPSIGVAGVVFAYQLRAQGGLGVPSAFVGPFVGVTFSVGLTRGSDLGRISAGNLAGAIATGRNTICKGVTVDIFSNFGVGFVDSVVVTKLLEQFYPSKKFKVTSDFLEARVPVFHGKSVAPDVPLCNEAS